MSHAPDPLQPVDPAEPVSQTGTHDRTVLLQQYADAIDEAIYAATLPFVERGIVEADLIATLEQYLIDFSPPRGEAADGA
jgi:hypothetical protein